METAERRILRMSRTILSELGKLASNRLLVLAMYALSVLYLVGLILLPTMLGVLTKLGSIQQVLSDPMLLGRAMSAIFSSFQIAVIVSLLDLLAGIPLAWLIARKKGIWITILDSFVDLPLIIPTVALGYSTLFFWSSSGAFGPIGFSLSPGWILVLLLHFSFSYPVVVRVMVSKIVELDQIYEIAGRTLGATPLAAARTISIPLLSSGILASFLLAFARSLSETGATIIVAGLFENGSVFIRRAKEAGLDGPLVFTSLVLIFLSLIIYYLLHYLGVKLRLPFGRAWPDIEKKLSGNTSVGARNSIAVFTLLIFVIAPALYLSLTYLPLAIRNDMLPQIFSSSGVWSSFWNSLVLSYTVGIVVSVLNTLLSLPMAIIIGRRRFGNSPAFLFDGLSAVPLIIPSVALGTSMSFFWSNFRIIPEFWLVVLAHSSITYPYLVATMVSALEDIPPYFEESARSLGADAFTVFRTVTLPLAKYSFISGIILTLTRSIDETGATLAVVSQLKTVPVLLVDWITRPFPGSDVAVGLGASLLLLISLLFLLTLRLLTRRGDRLAKD